MSEKPRLTLVSHHLCPYVQRAAIALAEKQVPFDRIAVDLAAKPDWFSAISPLGKVPLLRVVDAAASNPTILFESAAILEFLEDTQPAPLHPADPVLRARHRGWIEFGSTILNGIARLYTAPDTAAFQAAADTLGTLFDRVEAELGEGPWFAGARFTLVDAVFGPIFRYFDSFDRIGEFGILVDKPKIAAWRQTLAARPSVRDAVGADYPERLAAFLRARNSEISRRMH